MINNEKGRSMIEMLGVLAIVGVLSVGGIAGYSKAMAKFKTNKIIDQITMLSTNIRTLFGSQGSYAGLNNIVALRTGTVPAGMFDPSKTPSATASSTFTVTNSFNGYVQVGPATINDANDSFYIVTGAIPREACVTIATTDWGADAVSGLHDLVVLTGTSADSTSDKLADAVTAITGATSAMALGTSAATADGTQNGGDASKSLPMAVSTATTACANAFNQIAWRFL